MNRKYWAAAGSALALSAAALGATQASARESPEPGSGHTATPDCHWAYHPVCDEVPLPEPNYPEYNYPEYKLDVPTLPTDPTDPTGPPAASGDATGVDVLRAGASAIGGAGLALGGTWLYRRRHAPAV